MTQLVTESLTKLVELIRSRSVSPIEVAEAYLEQISRLNPDLNAIVTLAPDLMNRARSAEAAVLRGDNLGALHGVPFTVKDTIETAGLRTTSGSPIRANFVPERDAPAVALLKSAGAIILGKTNAAEMAMDYTADNPIFGRTNNPWNPSLTPGGSSGGEASAIASCMSPGGLGSDLAGSIRIPAHFCGIAGLKPATGRVPGDGQFPPSTGPYSLGAVIGPLARSVADLRQLFRVLANEESEGPQSLKGLRAAWYTYDGITLVTDETARVVATAATALSDAGLITQERRPPHVERAHDLWLQLFSRASVVQLRQVYSGREDEGGSFVSWRLRTADDSALPTLDQFIAAWMERDRLRTELLDWMETTPIIVCPVGATPAYKHDTLKVTVKEESSMGTFRAFSYAQAFNVFDLPVVSVPAGLSSDGLPIGVQIIGRPFAEEMIMTAAEIVEESVGRWERPC
jgi:Asp-tRNA(Asn)/Glu-tRNA(Gln) amidotransferase A subunit family amidase